MELLETLFPLGLAHYILGGLLIGLGVSLLFILTGPVGAMSSVYSAGGLTFQMHHFSSRKNIFKQGSGD